MPFLTRRRLASMLRELTPALSEAKSRDLIGRLEDRDASRSLAAEYELILTWAMSRATAIEIDRRLSSGETPDVFAASFFEAGPAYIDVMGVSDNSLSNEKEMTRAANIIEQFARRIDREAGQHLYFVFNEESGYKPEKVGRFTKSVPFRRRLITGKFKMTPELEARTAAWLRQKPRTTKLELKNEHIDVVIEWRERKVHPHGRTFSTMPAISYSLTKNPLYEALKRKADQLKSVPDDALRGIFVGDAGCNLLKDIRHKWILTYSGEQIIQEFLQDGSVDFVMAVVPRHRNLNAPWRYNDPRLWHPYVYRSGTKLTARDETRLVEMIKLLPNPRFYGYQARGWHEQNMFDPKGRGIYLPAQLRSGETMTYKIPSRLLQEYMAGIIKFDEFEHNLLKGNFILNALIHGKMISGVRLESGGIDEDDDYVVFEFSRNAAGHRLGESEDVEVEVLNEKSDDQKRE